MTIVSLYLTKHPVRCTVRGPTSPLISSHCPDFHHWGLFLNMSFKLLCKWEFANFPAGSFLLSNRSLKITWPYPGPGPVPTLLPSWCSWICCWSQLQLWFAAPVPPGRTGKGPVASALPGWGCFAPCPCPAPGKSGKHALGKMWWQQRHKLFKC